MNKGVTTIEMMVTIGLMAIMAAAVFFSWRPAEGGFSLTRSAHQLAGDLRRVQQLSISTRGFACVGRNPVYSGYGFYLNVNSPAGYYIFENCGLGNWIYNAGEETLWQSLESGVRIKSVRVEGVNPSSNQVSVVFVPPNPRVYIQEKVSGHEAVIVLELIGTNQVREVRINNNGRIDTN